MLSNNELKLLKNLSRKKYRDLQKSYIIEGVHGVEEALKFAPQYVEYILYSEKLPFQIPDNFTSYEVPPHKIGQLSSLKTAPGVLVKMKMPPVKEFPFLSGMVYYLDDITNPGNMGTIIRTTDWFGGRVILLGSRCVDIYNPKVVQATMGSLHRVDFYTEGKDFSIKKLANDYPIFGSDMDGTEYKKYSPSQSGIMAIGNESHGLSSEVSKWTTEFVTIPRKGEAESLNAAISHAILSSHFTI